ncbi:MAG: HEPN domain-containing protein [Phycisphaerae bacterium]|nr:HEPN domain-containing protein [Phycisphaerae bacterium]
MKDSLAKLPDRKRGELARITSVIRSSAPQTEMLILFGSYARGDAVEDVTVEGNTTYEYSSDFDILVIVKDEATANKNGFWYDIENKAGKLPVQTPITLIVHDIDFVNRKLEKGQYFFTDIKAEGIILYDSKNCTLADAKQLSPKERLGQAKADFKEYFQSANEFYDHYEYALSKNSYKKAAFMLHQAAEAFYATVLLVYTNYKPKTHKLDKLSKMASRYDSAFLRIFPLDTDEEKRRFDLLKQAYVGARYDKGYKITAEELKYLARCVELLRDQTQKSCKEKMESFVS